MGSEELKKSMVLSISILFIVCFSVFGYANDSDIVINEIYYHPARDCYPAEYIELTNRGTQPVDLSGWFLTEAVRFTFPNELILAPGSYCVIVQDLDTFHDAFSNVNSPILGPFERILSNSGESIVLLNQNSKEIDRVKWKDEYPWPVAADGLGASLELMNPTLDNSLPGHWLPSTGVLYNDTLPRARFDNVRTHATPGAQNSVYTETIPPVLSDITHVPQTPLESEDVVISLKVENPERLNSIDILYQVVKPGRYIRLIDDEYQDWITVPANDDGNYPDATADDGRFTGLIPGQNHRDLVRYKIEAINNNETETMAPHQTDPTPNFAYFVYNGIPPYRVTQPEERVHTVLDKVPVYHLIAHPDDIRDCEQIQTNKTTRNYFSWYGTFVYNGKVYDHIRFRLRGGVWRYTFNKRMWKIRFNKGLYIQGHFNDGTPYHEPRRTLNLNSITQNMNIPIPHRGELGLFETAGFWLFKMAGGGSFDTTWIHYRIIDNQSEEGNDQFSGDFYGLFLDVEQADDRYIKSHNFHPESSLYKMHRGWTGTNKIWEKETNNCNPPDDSDIEEFYQGYHGRKAQEFLERHLDIEKYLSYRCILEAIHHYDVYAEKNYYYMRNGATGLWQVLPWDLDITFGSDHGDGSEPFRDILIGDLFRFRPQEEKYATAFRNRLREILQLLYNEDVFFPVLDKWRDLIIEIARADLDRWDLFKPADAEPGKSRYKPLDVRLEEMKEWIRNRIDDDRRTLDLLEIAHDENIPHTPSIVSPQSNSTFKTNDTITFHSSEYFDPNNDFHVASRWIITEEGGFEIQPNWDSNTTQHNKMSITINLKDFQPGMAYHARIKHLDATNRWSHWSEPVHFNINKPVNVPEWQMH